MNNKILFGITLVATIVAIGVLSNDTIAEAAKPATEVIVTNTEPIQVTGIEQSLSQFQAVSGIVSGNLAGCVDQPIFLHIRTNVDGSGAIASGSLGNSEIHRIDVTENTVTLKGFYTNVDQGCALGSRELPGVFTLSGICGKGITVELTTDGGTSGTFTGNVACIP